MPAWSKLNTQSRLMKYVLPAPSVAMVWGDPIDKLEAAAGVGGGTPPAYVEITYCCSWAQLRVVVPTNRNKSDAPVILTVHIPPLVSIVRRTLATGIGPKYRSSLNPVYRTGSAYGSMHSTSYGLFHTRPANLKWSRPTIRSRAFSRPACSMVICAPGETRYTATGRWSRESARS